MEVKINGVSVNCVKESISIDDRIGERSTASFVIWDATGTAHYQKGEPYAIYDQDGELLISGVIEDSKEKQCSPGEYGILHNITGADNHYFADKRIAARSYKAKTAGEIVQDLVSAYLTAEGIIGASVTGAYTYDIDWQSGVLSGDYKISGGDFTLNI